MNNISLDRIMHTLLNNEAGVTKQNRIVDRRRERGWTSSDTEGMRNELTETRFQPIIKLKGSFNGQLLAMQRRPAAAGHLY